MNPLVKIRQYRMRPINKQAARVINDSFDETFGILPGSRRPANKAKAKKHGRRFNHPRRKQKQLCQYVNRQICKEQVKKNYLWRHVWHSHPESIEAP